MAASLARRLRDEAAHLRQPGDLAPLPPVAPVDDAHAPALPVDRQVRERQAKPPDEEKRPRLVVEDERVLAFRALDHRSR